MGAQLWFRNSILIFLVLALILIFNFLTRTSGPQISSIVTATFLASDTPTQSVTPVIQTTTPQPSSMQPTKIIRLSRTPTLPTTTDTSEAINTP